jgi:hypothetical protein
MLKYKTDSRKEVLTHPLEIQKMSKHHPDLVFCRKQPGIGKPFFPLISCGTIQGILNVRNTEKLLADCVKSATASASSVTAMSGRASSSKYATNAILARSRANASSAVEMESRMLTTAKNALSWKKMYRPFFFGILEFLMVQ